MEEGTELAGAPDSSIGLAEAAHSKVTVERYTCFLGDVAQLLDDR